MAVRYFGVTKNLDLDPSLIKPDVRPLRYKVNQFLVESGQSVLLLVAFMTLVLPFFNQMMQTTSGYSTGLMTAFYDVPEVFALLGVFWYWVIKSRSRDFMFRKPVDEDAPEQWDEETGQFYLGNDKDDFSSLWFAKDDMSVHFLVFGSTGSGKSRFLLGILYQCLLVGTSCMYVDGKGDNTVFWLVYSFARRVGREDDLLVINYLTGGDSIKEKSPWNHRLSNTNNPLSYGSADNLNSLIVGLMRDAGGDGAMWKGRARTMLKGLLNALVYKRDHEGLNLDIMEVRNYFPLDKIFNLSRDPSLEDSARDPLRKYLSELPGYSEEQAAVGEIPPKALEQHNFLTMQLTEVMSDLSETYGHIFGVPLGEIDFKDVVFNRRILFVLLPALEKDPDALEGLGKLVVAGVRSALAPSLGNQVEGSKRDVIDKKPTNSKTPFVLILDEYGYYSVPGFAVVAAQARSLGCSVIFAGQDYPSFQKASKEEAASTLANTNVKICMKLEDPEDTFKVIEARGGEAEVASSSGQEIKEGSLFGYSDQKTTRIEVKKRVNLRDLVRQGAGEAHVFYKDDISRCRFFFFDPPQAFAARLNSFIMCQRPKEALVRKIMNASTKLDNILTQKEAFKGSGKIADNGIKALFADMGVALKFNENPTDAAIHAIGMIEIRNKLKDIELKGKVDAIDSFDTDIPLAADESDNAPEETSSDDLATKIARELELMAKSSAKEPEYESDEDKGSEEEQGIDDSMDAEEINAMVDSFDEIDQEEMLSVLLSGMEDTSEDMEIEANLVAEKFATLLEDSVSANISKKMPYKSETMSPARQMAAHGENDEEEAMDALSKAQMYPEKPVPEKISQERLDDTLASILMQIESEEEAEA